MKKFKIQNAKIIGTLMSTSTKLDKDEKDKSDVKVYRGVIDSLFYLTASRPDILFSVCLFFRFQSSSKELHLHMIERIIRYVKSTSSFGLFYPKHTSFDLISYCDADFVGSKVDRKSTSDTC